MLKERSRLVNQPFFAGRDLSRRRDSYLEPVLAAPGDRGGRIPIR